MKRIITSLLITCLCAAAMAQIKPNFKSGKNRNAGHVIKKTRQDNLCIGTRQPNETVLIKSALVNVSLMQTVYDVPANSSTSERIYLYPDGTIGGCAKMAHDTNSVDQGFLSIGSHQLSIDAEGLTSGIYFYTFYLNKVGYSGKMVVKR